ncbi:MAG TPA: hypothetical protein VGL70_07305 [Candidatus Binatia bacterium]
MPAEFFALANAFSFALHNMLAKKALRYSNPATGVISSLLINIIFLWSLSILFVPLAPLASASILIFVVVGLFQPGPTRLLTYKGIDALGVAITVRFAPRRRFSAPSWRSFFSTRKSPRRSCSPP